MKTEREMLERRFREQIRQALSWVRAAEVTLADLRHGHIPDLAGIGAHQMRGIDAALITAVWALERIRREAGVVSND